MRDPRAGSRTTRSTPHAAPVPPTKPRKLEPLEFARWVDARAERLAESWLGEVRARQPGASPAVAALLERFLKVFTSMLSTSFGPYREQVEPLWLQLTDLFGSVAAQRGLAVGEAVEEFQILREVLIRTLYAEPPAGGQTPIPLRELIRLNRVIDRGVIQVSVGHADVLFFALFQGSGAPEHLSEEVLAEVEDQLSAIDAEFGSVMGSLGP